MRIHTLFTMCLGFFAPPVVAATFVGSGGNASDYELAMTMAQIRDAMSYVYLDPPDDKEKAVSPLCGCDIEGQETLRECQVLLTLSEDQKSYCSAIISKYASNLFHLANISGSIEFVWVNEPLQKPDEGNTYSAIAQVEEQRIILDEQAFLRLDQHARIALIVHELFHLIRDEGKPFDDDSPKGPFEKSSHLLNALGATVAVKADEGQSIESILNHHGGLSRAHPNHWFSLYSSAYKRDEDEAQALLVAPAKNTGAAFEYLYQPQNWGGFISFNRFANRTTSDSLPADIHAQWLSETVDLGISYRYFFPAGALSYWSQFHLRTSLGLSYGWHEARIWDSYQDISDTAESVGYMAAVEAIFPVIENFWVSFRMDAYRHRYDFDNIDISITKPFTGYGLGGKYAY